MAVIIADLLSFFVMYFVFDVSWWIAFIASTIFGVIVGPFFPYRMVFKIIKEIFRIIRDIFTNLFGKKPPPL